MNNSEDAQEAIVAKDFETVRKVSHRMKGAGGSYGFVRITEIAAVIEQVANVTDATVIQRERPLLGAYMDRVEVV